jgi:lysophospholipase L1-like esterase
MEPQILINHYRTLLGSLRAVSSMILILGLIPPDPECFPGSPEQFRHVNDLLRLLASLNEDAFFDWAPLFEAGHGGGQLWYADGFHPNGEGNKVLAEVLYDRLAPLGFPAAHGAFEH